MHCFILYDGECRPLQERHEWRPGADRELMVGICVQKDRAWAGRERTDLLVVYGRVLPGAWQTWLLLLMFSLSPPVWLTFTASLSCVSPVSSPLSGPSKLIVWLRVLESASWVERKSRHRQGLRVRDPLRGLLWESGCRAEEPIAS